MCIFTDTLMNFFIAFVVLTDLVVHYEHHHKKIMIFCKNWNVDLSLLQGIILLNCNVIYENKYDNGKDCCNKEELIKFTGQV